MVVRYSGFPRPLVRTLICAGLLSLAGSARADGPLPPIADEVWDAALDAGVSYRPVLSLPRWVVPSLSLPPEAEVQPSNNNLAIAVHDGRLFFAWRTAPSHFASDRTRLNVISSRDFGHTWAFETSVAIGRDVREPFLLSVGPRLFLYFAELGDRSYTFEPNRLWRMERLADGTWSERQPWGDAKEMAWEFKVRRGLAWVSSYRGKHYRIGGSSVEVSLRSSTDGVHWSKVGEKTSVYRGGVSEAAFEFDPTGRLWAVLRNEDGDDTGFGSLLATAPAGHLDEWSVPDRSSPNRYDSPRMFRHGSDIYVVARREIGPAFGNSWTFLPTSVRKLMLWPAYSLRPKRTALYRLDTEHRRLVPLLDLPSAGDTAFPSIARLDPNTYLIANYTSPLDSPDESWFRGQISSVGTGIYFVILRFEPLPASIPASPAKIAGARVTPGGLAVALSPAR